VVRVGAVRHEASVDARLAASEDVLYLVLNIKNLGNVPIAGVRVEVDGYPIPNLRATNTGTYFYVVALHWLEIVATEDNTHVVVEELKSDGSVNQRWSNTLNRGQHWRVNPNDLWVCRVASDKPIAVFTSSIGPSHDSDDDFYSLSGTDLWLWIPSRRGWGGKPGSVFIAAYHDDTVVTITDYTNGDDSVSFKLNAGEFMELPDAVETSPGEVWHIAASKPITVMAGFPENDEYEEVKSPYTTEYIFTLIGDNPYVLVQAQYDNTHVAIYDLNRGDSWSGTLSAGESWSKGMSYYHRANNVEWVRVKVVADKPVEVLNYDPGTWGASQHDWYGWINTALGNYRLYIVAATPASITVSGDLSWSAELGAGCWAYRDWPGTYRRLRIGSTGYIAIYTIANGWHEGITPAFPILWIGPGMVASISGFLKLDNPYVPHTLTVYVYFLDGSVKAYTLSIGL